MTRILLSAAKSKQKPNAPPKLQDDAFRAQTSFLCDVAQLIVVLCTRRAGKSFGAALRLLRAAFRFPGSSSLYVALTRDSAKKILWKDCLKVINRRLKLGIRFNETELSATLPNGSVIYLLGVDTTEEEKDKLLGQKYAEVVIDEGASYSIDMMALVYGVLKPAVADYRGTICFIGTPGNLKKGLFFDLTSGQDPGVPGRWEKLGWSGHRWSAKDNPHMAEKWAAEIADLIAANPLIQETPLFQQNYLGRWVIDESKLVYRYQKGRNDFNGELPVLLRGRWHHVLGIDLGSVNATAFSILAYHDFTKTLYVRRAWKKSGLDITDTAEIAKSLQAEFDVDLTVIDGAAKQSVEELNRRHALGAKPADKKDKAVFIDIMNAEMIQGRILFSPDTQPLKDEYGLLIWNERSTKREEHPGCDNDSADSCLYPWRYCYSYLADALNESPREGSEEWRQQQVDAMLEDARKQLEARQQDNEWWSQ